MWLSLIINIAILVLLIILLAKHKKETFGNKKVTFEDLKKLWPPEAKTCMGDAVKLWDYKWVKDNHKKIMKRLNNKEMPPGGGWPDDKIAKVQAWIDGGMKK
jgi:hypothetical protein